jgi:hypothetical protein
LIVPPVVAVTLNSTPSYILAQSWDNSCRLWHFRALFGQFRVDRVSFSSPWVNPLPATACLKGRPQTARHPLLSTRSCLRQEGSLVPGLAATQLRAAAPRDGRATAVFPNVHMPGLPVGLVIIGEIRGKRDHRPAWIAGADSSPGTPARPLLGQTRCRKRTRAGLQHTALIHDFALAEVQVNHDFSPIRLGAAGVTFVPRRSNPGFRNTRTLAKRTRHLPA